MPLSVPFAAVEFFFIILYIIDYNIINLILKEKLKRDREKNGIKLK